ncbi:hypothetical protein [Streptomyces sp. NPDC017520]|uniref:hypothetical protein n=1 Tax=Streptomyces sp. NPDC017520 TaxID=3364998 RepID=UPI0037B43A4B
MSTQYGTDTLQYLKDAEYSNGDQALTSIDANASQGKASAAAAMFHYAESVGMTEQEKRVLFADTETQYNNGVTAARHLGKVN